MVVASREPRFATADLDFGERSQLPRVAFAHLVRGVVRHDLARLGGLTGNEDEKRKEYKKAVRALYEALKGHDVQESMTLYKSSHPSHEELEDDMRTICANAAYSPIPFTATMGAIRKYKEYYSDEMVDQIYKSQTRYMLFDKEEFKNLLRRIANDENFDYFKFIDDRWDEFVTQYMKTH